jgi:hypothetical protein
MSVKHAGSIDVLIWTGTLYLLVGKTTVASGIQAFKVWSSILLSQGRNRILWWLVRSAGGRFPKPSPNLRLHINLQFQPRSPGLTVFCHDTLQQW